MDLELRKLRKKLRAIERLETHSSLTNDEQRKLAQRPMIQSRVAELLSQIEQNPVEQHTSNLEQGEETREEFDDDDDDVDGDYGPGALVHSSSVQRIVQGNHKRKSESDNEENAKVRKCDVDRSFSTSSVEDAISDGGSVIKETTEQDREMLNEPSSSYEPQQTRPPASEVASRGDVSSTQSQNFKGNSVKKQSPNKPVTREVSGDEIDAKQFRKCRWFGSSLKGHNDIVFSVDVNDPFIVTGSRDTMVKVWDLKSGDELRTLLGHTSSVTAVKIIPVSHRIAQSQLVIESGESAAMGNHFCVSASADCSVKLWNLTSGVVLQSVYTFNPLSSLSLLELKPLSSQTTQCVVACGTEAGKLQVWDVLSKTQLFDRKCHDDSITCLKMFGKLLCSSGYDGLIKLWKVSCLNEKDCSVDLNPVFVSTDLTRLTFKHASAGGSIDRLGTKVGVAFGRMRALEVDEEENLLFVGDDGPNIKIIDWKNGSVVKLRNHVLDFGYTDCLQLTRSLFFSSSFDIDSGNGTINVYHRPRRKHFKTLEALNQLYITSVYLPENSGRIFAMSALFKQDQTKLSLLVGGRSLILCWNSEKGDSGFSLTSRMQVNLGKNSVLESDHEGNESCASDDGSLLADVEYEQMGREKMQLTKHSVFWDWCNVL